MNKEEKRKKKEEKKKLKEYRKTLSFDLRFRWWWRRNHIMIRTILLSFLVSNITYKSKKALDRKRNK